MATTTTYTGSCHCGNVRFEVAAQIESVKACNCSICSRAGHLLTFVPAAQVKLLAGLATLTDYQFNKKNVHHTFCSTCGIRCFGHGNGRDGQPMYAVNVRCLDGVDVDALPVKRVDGKSL